MVVEVYKIEIYDVEPVNDFEPEPPDKLQPTNGKNIGLRAQRLCYVV